MVHAHSGGWCEGPTLGVSASEPSPWSSPSLAERRGYYCDDGVARNRIRSACMKRDCAPISYARGFACLAILGPESYSGGG